MAHISKVGVCRGVDSWDSELSLLSDIVLGYNERSPIYKYKRTNLNEVLYIKCCALRVKIYRSEIIHGLWCSEDMFVDISCSTGFRGAGGTAAPPGGQEGQRVSDSVTLTCRPCTLQQIGK